MAGKNCVAVACDMRYGMQNQTVATDRNKVFKMHDRFPCSLHTPPCCQLMGSDTCRRHERADEDKPPC